jgi:DMSO/TMAO reductase YedYZ molybdopterin-dependent catalytic subunit
MNPPADPTPPALFSAPGEAVVLRELRRRTRRSFLVGGAAAAAGYLGWRWLSNAAEEDGAPWPLRRALQFNERLWRGLYREARLAPTFPADNAAGPRVNGHIGLSGGFDPARWRLTVEGPGGRVQRFTLDDIRNLPRAEMATELKCIEGWSEVVAWAGASFRDFLVHYRLGTRSGDAPDLASDQSDLYRHVSLETPDGGYYVGLDMESALHPQTLLCYEMGGAPLAAGHGAPLRLVVPLKYGIKNIKRVGRIRFSDDRPADYWAERGYDWYAGH